MTPFQVCKTHCQSSTTPVSGGGGGSIYSNEFLGTQARLRFSRDFPDGPVVKNPPCKAGDMGSIPGWGTKMPHAEEQLSQLAASSVPMCLHHKSSLCAQDPHDATKTQRSQINKVMNE